ncbi:FtsX-like permease family protein [Micromonospora sp. NBC_01796]|uniref:FtsX-like permease family protein n=1 Tax=Micromonospora sp. NBC_01796 TaxID=2975987 RepID=UPI002DDC65CA|nr:FtsX-like permease family protein [Micromonospora sp. NBC_01796]WSA88783.1 FtsX-like permease family protein [Micromonospora sp. NBC_01796]
MRLVLRRARAVRGLLLAATGATLIAAALLTGLAGYSRQVVDTGTASAIDSSAPEERSILVRGSTGGSADALRDRDAALRREISAGLAGLPAPVSAAGYAAGRQLSGPVGKAVPDGDGVVFGSVVFLDNLAEHAELSSGNWPQPGANPVQTALAEPVAKILGVAVGDRIPVTDRVTGRVSNLAVAGIWHPRDPEAAYWRLSPDVAEGHAAQSSTYGPLTVDRADFINHFAANASAAWLVEPDLNGASVAQLGRLADTVRGLTAELPKAAGLGTSGITTTAVDRLAERLERANLVGRSALVTPMLLVIVLGGYALVLVAALLVEQRRGENSLLRARGAARNQLAGLAVREATLVVLPAALLAPLLATEGLRLADRVPMLASVGLRFDAQPAPLTWLVAALAAIGCALAIIGPSLRRSGTYVAELASRSRPSRRAVAQRAGIDLALIALAVLGWLQLRQYSSPLAGARSTGQLGIDPLLAATPTLGVLAGAVLALRVLPPITRLAERLVDRKPWTATMFGTWQAGRRPHAGPVLLLALAVAVSTLAWCLASTSERSLRDQAAHQVGTDLRLVETSDAPPAGRAEALAGLPGVREVLPAWRESLRLGPDAQPASLIAIDTRAGADSINIRQDMVDTGSPADLLREVGGQRVEAPYTELPAGARKLSGTVRTTAGPIQFSDEIRTDAVFAEPNGGFRRVPLGTSRNGRALRFDIDLPAGSAPVRLAGFVADTLGQNGMRIDWTLSALTAGTGDAAGTPVDLTTGGSWQTVDRLDRQSTAAAGVGGMSTQYEVNDDASWGATTVRVAMVRQADTAPIPVLVTPAVLDALRLKVGDETGLAFGLADARVKIVGTVASIPGDTEPAAILTDLPSLSNRFFFDHGIVRTNEEWWVTTDPAQASAAAQAAAQLDGLEVLDRQAIADQLDPYGVGARGALFAAALGALLLAAVGIGVDVSATARRRVNELAVLHTLGAGHRLLARSLIAEQAFLSGIGVLVGLGVGVAVAATMAPLVILTPSADRPSPPPLLSIDWPPVIATTVGLLLLALLLSGLIATTLRQRLVAAQLRIGDDR